MRFFTCVLCSPWRMGINMLIDIATACGQIKAHDNFLIISHQRPDGDTLGASFALLYALQSMGKSARAFCVDGFPSRYGFIYGDYMPDESFEAGFVIATDTASRELIGSEEVPFADRVDLCIDHHKSNTLFAKATLLDAEAPAACQIVLEVIKALGVTPDKRMATAIFTGLSTDTGCFKYSSVTANTHRAAAEVIELGAEHGKVNKLMFDTKSRGALMVNNFMIETTKFYCGDKCAVSVIPVDICEKYGVSEDELDGISSFTIRIDGVFAGVTVRVKPNNTYRVSLRTVSPCDASGICSKFGGGGHANAAGCTMTGELDEVIQSLVASIENELRCIDIV